MIFSVYSVNMVFLFSTNMILLFCQKKQRQSSPKKMHLKIIFLVSLKKMIFILKSIVFPLIKKLQIKKIIFIKKFK